MSVVHNQSIRQLRSRHYSLKSLMGIYQTLLRHNTFEFPRLETGLFSASASAGADYTGYASAWVRDNIHIAHAHYVVGKKAIAVNNIETLLQYFTQHRGRLETIIRAGHAPEAVMERPHIRFNGQTLQELDQTWAHAQNDALGYFVWFVCQLTLSGDFRLSADHCQLLALFALYFQAIRYWEDEDSGHWEEARKIEASSLGAVVAGLTLLKHAIAQSGFDSQAFSFEDQTVTVELLEDLISQGRAALNRILPAECIQPGKGRPYDAALLFLIYPLAVVDDTMADQILENVITHLQGDYGIKRYLGDSFWAADYKTKLSPESRTIDFSDDMSARDALLKDDEEAQWCIFDPIVSVIFGLKYQATGDPTYLDQQGLYFNRALGQLTAEDSSFGGFRCPELYYLESGQYVPNDVTPLLWTQANLWLAFHHLAESLGKSSE
ncbi:MAG: glycoside hydrolase family 15 protein [Cyanobacteria bacterium P01_G01_bin.38]